MKKKKVLFVHHGTGVGGAPISMVETIKGLNKNHYDVEVLLLKDSTVKDLLKKEGIKFSVESSLFYSKYYQFFPHIMPQYFKWYQLFRIFIYSIRWVLSRYYFSFKVLSKFDYDIVHLNSSVLSDFLCAGSRYGKTVIHIREPLADGYFGVRKGVIKKQIRYYADHVIAISKDNSKRLGVFEKTTVVYNFTEIKDYELNLEMPLLNKILYLGGGDKIKGFLTVVDALDYLDPSVKVLFAGNYQIKDVVVKGWEARLRHYTNLFDSDVSRMNEAMVKIRTHPNAQYIGLSMDVHSLLHDSTFLISPFVIEHFSRPIIEAFANMKPVIATNIEGMNEIVDDNVDGLLVDRNKPRSLAKAINYLNANPELIRQMGVNGYEKAKKIFSPNNVADIERIYNDLG